jgi:hypothetical protein
MSRLFQRRFIVIFMVGIFSLTGCGGGGSSTTAPACTVCFTQASGSGNNILAVTLNGASTPSTALFDLTGTGLNSTLATGASADFIFDSSWMTFVSFSPDTGSNGVSYGIASVLEGNPNNLVVGLYKFKGSANHLGTITFSLSGTGHTATLAFASSTTYIGSPVHVLASPHLTALGGVLKN